MTILILDIGSSSVRAALFDHDAHLIDGAQVQKSHQMRPDGTFDAGTLQMRVESCIDEILKHPAAETIDAVGMDTFVGNMVGLDSENLPLTPLMTYAETRATHDLDALRPIYMATDTHQRTGCPHYTAYLPSQLAWLRRHEPQTLRLVHQWCDLGSFLYRQWFGGTVPISYSCASWTGLLHRQPLTWDAIWLDALDLTTDTFAPLADFNTVQQGLRSDYRLRWSALTDVPFYLAIGDGAAANIGSGATDERYIALTIGTTAALRVVTTDHLPRVPDGLWGYRVDAQRHLIGGATTEGGNIYQWVQKTYQLPNDAEAQIANRDWGAHGLTFVPLLGGERTPGYNPHATGSITGLRLDTTPVDILQAALEGVTLRLKMIFDQIPKRATPKIYAGGGALQQSAIWAQMIADQFACPLQLVEGSVATARGVACLVLSEQHGRDLGRIAASQGRLITPR